MILTNKIIFFVLSFGISIQCIRGISEGDTFSYPSRSSLPERVTLRSNGLAFCDGVIISKQHILTAASCLIDKTITYLRKPSNIVFTIVSEEISTRIIHNYTIEKMFYHKDFTINQKLFPRKDIAILKLTNEIVIHNKKLEDPLKPIANPLNENDQVFMYGLKNINNKITTKNLFKVILTISPSSVCEKSLDVKLDCQQLCATVNQGHELFRRDRGAALFHEHNIIGVLSHMDFYNDNRVVVITNISPYRKWINYAIKFENNKTQIAEKITTT